LGMKVPDGQRSTMLSLGHNERRIGRGKGTKNRERCHGWWPSKKKERSDVKEVLSRKERCPGGSWINWTKGYERVPKRER